MVTYRTEREKKHFRNTEVFWAVTDAQWCTNDELHLLGDADPELACDSAEGKAHMQYKNKCRRIVPPDVCNIRAELFQGIEWFHLYGNGIVTWRLKKGPDIIGILG